MKLSATLFLAFSVLFISACATGTKQPAVSEDGLALTEVRGLDTVYWKPGVDLANFSSVMIERPSVAFRNRWLDDQNRRVVTPSQRVTEEDMQRISSWLSDALLERFGAVFDKAGFPAVSSPAGGTLLLRPAIVKLDVLAPDLSMRQASIQKNYTVDISGEMTLQMDVLDASSMEIIGRVTDRRESRNPGVVQLTNSVTNRGDANLILNHWARALLEPVTLAHNL